MFALEVEYLLGRAFAAEFGRQDRPEWPPEPGRLFAALAAAYFENGATATERRALEWLEQQPAPRIRAGEPGVATVPDVFVPTNYKGDGPPALRGKQPRQFPAQGPSEATAYFIWPDAEVSTDVVRALDELASRVACLGRACSLVRMRVCDSNPEANYEPHPKGDLVIRVASRGRLGELEMLFQSDRRPSAGAQALYRRVGASAEETADSEFLQMAVFEKVAGPGLPIEGALTLTAAVRDALMSNAGNAGDIPALLHGHDGETHCAIAALPFVGRQHADGRLMGFAVVFPRNCGAQEKRKVLAACHGLGERGVHIPGIGDWQVLATNADTTKQTLRPATWTQPSRVWRTTTPIVLDRFPKKKGPTVEDILRTGCRRIGLPDPTAIEHGPYSEVEGVPPVPAFRLRRDSDERPRWAVHATLKFAVSVRGPVLVGAGRYFGLGLMRPQWEARNGGN
jgi:CRISPR-associated protein Csb2